MSRRSVSRRQMITAAALMLPVTRCVTSAAEPTPPRAEPNGPQVKPIGAFVKDARILFQGDSITDGNRGRNTDPNHILGHGYVFITAAKFGAAFPELNLDFVNRGVSGNAVPDLAARWQKDTLDLKPDLLSQSIRGNRGDSLGYFAAAGRRAARGEIWCGHRQAPARL